MGEGKAGIAHSLLLQFCLSRYEEKKHDMSLMEGDSTKYSTDLHVALYVFHGSNIDFYCLTDSIGFGPTATF